MPPFLVIPADTAMSKGFPIALPLREPPVFIVLEPRRNGDPIRASEWKGQVLIRFQGLLLTDKCFHINPHIAYFFEGNQNGSTVHLVQ